MTVQEAIQLMKSRVETATELMGKGADGKAYEDMEMAIEAMEKQIPKKPNEYEDKYYACPNCENVLMMKWSKYPTIIMPRVNGLPYCMACGQHILWEEGGTSD